MDKKAAVMDAAVSGEKECEKLEKDQPERAAGEDEGSEDNSGPRGHWSAWACDPGAGGVSPGTTSEIPVQKTLGRTLELPGLWQRMRTRRRNRPPRSRFFYI